MVSFHKLYLIGVMVNEFLKCTQSQHSRNICPNGTEEAERKNNTEVGREILIILFHVGDVINHSRRRVNGKRTRWKSRKQCNQ